MTTIKEKHMLKQKRKTAAKQMRKKRAAERERKCTNKSSSPEKI